MTNKTFYNLLIGFIIGYSLSASITLTAMWDEYKQGQIDYANGIIKYELKKQPDSTVVWEKK